MHGMEEVTLVRGSGEKLEDPTSSVVECRFYNDWVSDQTTKSVATTSQRSSHLHSVTSTLRTRPMSSDLASRKSEAVSTHGPLCLVPSPYDSNADSCDGNDSSGEGGHRLPQCTMNPGLPSNATSQLAYDSTITTYKDDDYIVSSQPSQWISRDILIQRHY